MQLRRVEKRSYFGDAGWEQVKVLCIHHWLEKDEPGAALQDSIGWRLIAADEHYFYLGRDR